MPEGTKIWVNKKMMIPNGGKKLMNRNTKIVGFTHAWWNIIPIKKPKKRKNDFYALFSHSEICQFSVQMMREQFAECVTMLRKLLSRACESFSNCDSQLSHTISQWTFKLHCGTHNVMIDLRISEFLSLILYHNLISWNAPQATELRPENCFSNAGAWVEFISRVQLRLVLKWQENKVKKFEERKFFC